MLDKIVSNGYCVGCGACASTSDAQRVMQFSPEDGRYWPLPLTVVNEKPRQELCPFADHCENEDEISEELFGGQPGIMRSEATGFHIKSFAGYAKSDGFRREGSSGGIVNWLASKLLETDRVDGIIHVKSSNQDGILFEYGISANLTELRAGAKSRYYPVEISQVMAHVRDHPGRYAFIGVPCFVKAVRLLSKSDPVISQRIVFTISLVCGHLKSDRFAKSMAWELGIQPNDLRDFDFRVKQPGRKANDYGVEATGLVEGAIVSRQALTKELLGANWSNGLFKLSACDYCDDVIGETSDISIGDAWLPKYVDESEGTNVVVVRSPEILGLVESYREELHLDEIPIDEVIQSQAGGFRHRREGLSYRLFLKDRDGLFRPRKRVEASSDISNHRKLVYQDRIRLIGASDEAYEQAVAANRFQVLRDHLAPLLESHSRLLTSTFKGRLISTMLRVPILRGLVLGAHRLLRSGSR